MKTGIVCGNLGSVAICVAFLIVVWMQLVGRALRLSRSAHSNRKHPAIVTGLELSRGGLS